MLHESIASALAYSTLAAKTGKMEEPVNTELNTGSSTRTE